MRYSQIYNPKTRKFVNIYGRLGKSILKKYLEHIGGAESVVRKPQMMRQNSVGREEGVLHIESRIAGELEFPSYTFEVDEPVYIIHCHGIIRKIQHHFPISGLENVRYGVLVNEGEKLSCMPELDHQRTVIKHIDRIIDGKMKIYERYPFKLTATSSVPVFPNIWFQAGGGEFIATIVKITREPHSKQIEITSHRLIPEYGRLVPFQRGTPFEGKYPLQVPEANRSQADIFFNYGDKLTDLYEIAKAIKLDSPDARQINICIASCLSFTKEAVEQFRTHEFHEKWLGRHSESLPHILKRKADSKGKINKERKQNKRSDKKGLLKESTLGDIRHRRSKEQLRARLMAKHRRLRNKRSDNYTKKKARERGEITLAEHIAREESELMEEL